MSSARPGRPVAPTFAEASRFWLKLGFISFGGPAGQIAIMHEELVERRRWISEDRFLHALNYCMLLPGPEAQQLAIYLGWLLHRTWGGIVAGTLFVLPAAFLLYGLSWIYVAYGNVPWIAAAFQGLKPAVLAIVATAVIRIGRRSLRNEVMWSVAGLAFVALYFLKVPVPVIVVVAGILGLAGGKWLPAKFLIIQGPSTTTGTPDSVLGHESTPPEHARPTLGRAVRVVVICLLLWWLPVGGLALWLGPDHSLVREGLFFSQAAMVTFGGAYAVLPYVAQQAVEHYSWLGPVQMLDGLALAETTPGPLIIVLQFVGFLGAWNQPGTLSSPVAATLGAFITTWTTFLPCFLWIFLGAPYLEQLRGNRRLNCALSTISAAVVGVLFNLAVWFGVHLLFTESREPDWFSWVVAGVAFLGMQRWKWSVIPVVFAGAVAGIVWNLILGGT